MNCLHVVTLTILLLPSNVFAASINRRKVSSSGVRRSAFVVGALSLMSVTARGATDWDLMDRYYEEQVKQVSGPGCSRDMIFPVDIGLNCPNPDYYSAKLIAFTSPFKSIKDETCSPCSTEVAGLDAREELYKLKVEELLARKAKHEEMERQELLLRQKLRERIAELRRKSGR